VRPWRVLTIDERRVLSLLSEGLSVAEVAACFAWTPQRVTDCLAGAEAALGAHSQLEAIVLACRRGELSCCQAPDREPGAKGQIRSLTSS